jgi:GTP-binding protein
MAESNEQSAEKLPVVAIVGRPNVGKSTLFNRVVGKRLAIVEEKPKVTRDRKEVKAMWAGREFELVDTGGWIQGGDALDEKVSAQAEAAARLADLVIFVVDVTVGITEDDAAAARMLQRSKTPCVVAVNKVDSEKLEPSIWEFSALGLGTPWPISALHGRSSGDLLDHVVETVDAPFERFDDELDLPGARGFDKERNEKETAVAIVGRPNVGKSTLFNRLIGADRSVTHDMPGTTTDSIDTVIERDGHQLRFIDTAGLRRKSKIGDGTEYFSMVRSLKAIDDADISLLVIDARDGVTAQDQRLAEPENPNKLGFLAYLMPIRISALSGHNVVKIWAAIDEARTAYRSRIPTRELNKLMESIQIAHPPKNTKILYAVQGATDPPTMTLFTTKAVEPTYLRYVENRIRERFGLGTTPLKLRVRRRTH